MDDVPVIDISRFETGDDAERQRIAAEVARAVEEIGFLSVTGHGVPQKVIDDMRAGAWRFFGAPLGAKEAYLHPLQNLNRGYTPLEGEFNGASNGEAALADLREGYIFGPFERPEPASELAAYAWQPNIWPEGFPGLSDTFRAYYEAVSGFNALLLRVFAAALDLPEDYFRDKFDVHSSTVRVLHYPAQDGTPPDGQLRCGAHTDFGSHTILLADDAPGGLQVRTRGGEWIDVVPPADAFLINIGDMMMMWTNDRWLSNAHRVANPPATAGGSAERLSIAFFAYPNPDALIECIPTCLAPGADARHPPVVAGEYRRMKVTRTTAAAQQPAPASVVLPG